MPVTCFFVLNDRPVSMLFCPGVGSIAAFSGKEAYVDNPAATAVANAGPLPKGTYYIINRQSGGRFGWLRDWIKDASPARPMVCVVSKRWRGRRLHLH